MKVAMIGLRGIPDKSGGIENVVENLAPRLVKLGADVTVYCRTPYCTERPTSWKGVKLTYLPAINTKHLETLTHSSLATIHAALKGYDIVHFHAMGNSLFSILPRLSGKKTIVTLHGLDYEREKWGTVAKAFLKVSEMAVLVFPNKAISVSKKMQRLSQDRMAFIPNGVSIPRPAPLERLKRFGLKKDGFILSLGRMVPEKEVHTLIQAFKCLDTDLKLAIVGDATHADAYANKVRDLAKDDPRIIFTGPLYGQDKAEAFSNCLFFVLPSTIEGMPIVLLEAMSYGRCVLTSDIEENKDVNTQGYTFKVKDVVDLRKKLLYMTNHKESLEKKGRLGKELVKKEYTWDHAAQDTMALYRKTLS